MSRGGKRVGSGRKPGVPNKITASLKEAILSAAADVGQDGKGADGLLGYLRHVAKADVKAYATLLGKVLPMQITGQDDGPIKTVTRIELVGVRPAD